MVATVIATLVAEAETEVTGLLAKEDAMEDKPSKPLRPVDQNDVEMILPKSRHGISCLASALQRRIPPVMLVIVLGKVLGAASDKEAATKGMAAGLETDAAVVEPPDLSIVFQIS